MMPMTEKRTKKAMKLFISADIEGCAGLAIPAEAHKQETVYGPFARERCWLPARRPESWEPGRLW